MDTKIGNPTNPVAAEKPPTVDELLEALHEAHHAITWMLLTFKHTEDEAGSNYSLELQHAIQVEELLTHYDQTRNIGMKTKIQN